MEVVRYSLCRFRSLVLRYLNSSSSPVGSYDCIRWDVDHGHRKYFTLRQIRG